MRFRSKLLLLLLPVCVGGQLLVGEIIERRGEALLFQQFQAKALAIAASAAVSIDAEAHGRILQERVLDSPEMKILETQLRLLRNANRREDTWVRFLYTIIPSAEEKGLYVYAVDPEEEVEMRSRLGDIVRAKEFRDLDIGTPGSFPDFVKDEFGEWLTAYHPIRDASHRVVGAVVADIEKGRVLRKDAQLSDSMMLSLALGLALAGASVLLISAVVSRPLEQLSEGMAEIGRGNFDAAPPQRSRDEFDKATEALRSMAAALKERERVKSAFSRYVSHQVAEVVLKSHEPLALQGERRRITVLFSDIRGFTTMSERLPPEKVVGILNEYFEQMVDVVFAHQGTLDKFMGDGLMAIFGAPHEDAFQEEHAVLAALEMRRRLAHLSSRVLKESGVDVRVGIGINSGVAIVGTIGSSQRMEYTAIGDTVNLASRLESRTKEEGVDLLLSEYTFQSVRARFGDRLRRVGSVTVKGRSEPVVVYTVADT